MFPLMWLLTEKEVQLKFAQIAGQEDLQLI